MKSSKTTRRALLGSFTSLLLCFAMLIGSTFAWFTDTASTSVNTIQAGTLDVKLLDANGDSLEGTTLKWQKAEGHENEAVLWEPGCTYSLQPIVIKNGGDLALKYKIAITGIQGSAKLNEAIDWTVQVSANEANAQPYEAALGADHSLAAGASDLLTISGTMKTSAGNEYQGEKIEGIAITVYATQLNSEYDSNGNTYDQNAEYSISYPANVTDESFGSNVAVSADGTYYSTFTEALSAGGTIYLKKGATVPSYNTHPSVTKDITIYANGATFNNDISIGTYATPGSSTVNVTIYDAKNLTVWGEPKSNGTTWNVSMFNCEVDGQGLLMYRADTGTDKINFIARNCKASNVQDGIHTTAGGTISLENCVFIKDSAGINIAHKFDADMTVAVKNCSFIECGKVNPSDDYFAPARFVNTNANGGKLTVTMENNTFTDTVGTNGDVLIGDFRTGKVNKPVTVSITGTGDVTVKNSTSEAGSVTLPYDATLFG